MENEGHRDGGRPDADARSAAAPDAGGGDAESGNTASHNCKGEERDGIPFFQVLWKGIDTLELSFPGRIKEEVDAELKRLKAAAQSSAVEDRAHAQWRSGDRYFEVLDRGSRFFAYALRHPDMRIMVASGNSRRGVLAFVVFGNEFLVTAGPEQAAKEARWVVTDLGTVPGIASVSRCDMAVDIYTHQAMEGWSREAWVTRAQRVAAYAMDGKFSGWTVGQGADIGLRLYDKTLEMASNRDKPYFRQLWTDAGWFPGDAVFRLEVQWRRAALTELGIESVEDVLSAEVRLWAYATQEWTRLSVPNPKDETRSRWEVHPFWQAVQAVPWDGDPGKLARRRSVNLGPSDAMVTRYFKACLTAIMARDRLGTAQDGVAKLLELLGQDQEHARLHAIAEALIENIVLLKRRQYCSAFNT